jgi:ATP adenylyltransferase
VTPLELIWNGWRAEYVSGGAHGLHGPGSVFTQILASGLSDEDAYIVHRGETVFAVLNAFPYTTGHLMVVPYREEADLESLTAEETAELWSTVSVAVATLKSVYLPGGINVGLNLGRAAGGSVSEHLHVHVLPRWVGDGNFMTSVANARTLPEPLARTASRIRTAWRPASP